MPQPRPAPTRRGLLAGAAAIGLPLARAQSAWPPAGRSIRFVAPFVPGSTSDIVARTTAKELARVLGAPVVVDNRAGGGVPSMQDVARPPGDGLTVILGHVGTMFAAFIAREQVRWKAIVGRAGIKAD